MSRPVRPAVVSRTYQPQPEVCARAVELLLKAPPGTEWAAPASRRNNGKEPKNNLAGGRLAK